MKQKLLWAAWGCLYIVCVGLGTVENPQGFGRVLLVLTALIFFVPGWALLYLGRRDAKCRRGVRIAAICSLSLTACLLVANMLSVRMSERAGAVLHDLLALVSAPMLCSQYWVLSLFLWAVLLFASLKRALN